MTMGHGESWLGHLFLRWEFPYVQKDHKKNFNSGTGILSPGYHTIELFLVT